MYFYKLEMLCIENSRTALKAAIMAFLTAVTVVAFTASYWKAVWIGLSVFVLALFSTWRRLLEPLCFFAFVAAIVVICADDPGILAKVRLAAPADVMQPQH